jgi:hypothetical protein
MKRLNLVILLAIITLVTGGGVLAQEEPERQPRKFGIGIERSDVSALEDRGGDYQGVVTGFYLPIQATPKTRFEPKIGILRYADTEREDSYTRLDALVGYFGLITRGDYQFYYGARAGFLVRVIKSQDEGDSFSTWTQRRGYLTPAIGGEYYFSPYFSLGGEARLVFSSFDEDEEARQSFMASEIAVMIRFYIP